MAGGTKPAIKVYMKSASGGGFLDLVAFWRGDNGMLRGSFDRGVKAIKIVDRDGREHVLRPDEKGRVDGWYLNAREESAAPAPRARAAARPAPRDDGADLFGDDTDDVPF